MRFSIADAFTDKIFEGNPAGIVFIDERNDFPSDEIMQKTAAELRYSETAFIKKIGNKEFRTRYFTPVSEIDLCGHATIGGFSFLLHEGVVQPKEKYINYTLAGPINIETGEDDIFMEMAEPRNILLIDATEDVEELYGVMGISYNDQKLSDGTKLLPRVISTGLPDIILPVSDENQLNSISPDFNALSVLSKRYNVVGVHAFTLNSADGNIHCRNFAPLYGINEESATGTSNGALTYYLYLNKIIEKDSVIQFIQGEAMGRSSKIIGKLSSDKKIQIGGNAAILASGDIDI
jgi:PhzF family phenazine biosynthesis protein